MAVCLHTPTADGVLPPVLPLVLPVPAAYFVFLGMLAVVACIDPQLRPLVPKSLGEREMEICVPAIPVVLKVRWNAAVCAAGGSSCGMLFLCWRRQLRWRSC
jgi:hypothetical protein